MLLHPNYNLLPIADRPTLIIILQIDVRCFNSSLVDESNLFIWSLLRHPHW